jgi:branched-chain amino acid transport system ATP-binding protein
MAALPSRLVNAPATRLSSTERWPKQRRPSITWIQPRLTRLSGESACTSRPSKAISNLLRTERGEVTKGSIVFEGREVQALSPDNLVKRGCIQVMEGRRCFGHLSVEDNLVAGAFTRRDGKAAIRRDLDLVYD